MTNIVTLHIRGNLKIGLFNATDYAIKIYPGIRIAQMVFEELKSRPSEMKQYKNKKMQHIKMKKSLLAQNYLMNLRQRF